eukprot:TRINITY_DN22633_c0_g1_i1.p1 TRINITY_DN22633_c0_g1~~TRINITY_DN22633_c0_g1_i1.p1  ORF type:complete len:345 (+),score=50.76 TRINITY_DN22633_c0_g1_i1:134-1036(+)
MPAPRPTRSSSVPARRSLSEILVLEQRGQHGCDVLKTDVADSAQGHESQSEAAAVYLAAENHCVFSLSPSPSIDLQPMVEGPDIDIYTSEHPGPDADDVLPSDFLMFATSANDWNPVVDDPPVHEEKKCNAILSTAPVKSKSDKLFASPSESAAAALKAKYQAFGGACLASIANAESTFGATRSYRGISSNAMYPPSGKQHGGFQQNEGRAARRGQTVNAKLIGSSCLATETAQSKSISSTSHCARRQGYNIRKERDGAETKLMKPFAVGVRPFNADAAPSFGTCVNATQRHFCLSTVPS